MHHNGFGLQVVVDGRPLPEFGHEGKTCVVAAPGHDYAVRLYVPRFAAAGMRYLAVLTVDGVDSITGKIKTPDGPGYILHPCQLPYDIPGFRITTDRVTAFRFPDHKDTDASSRDKPLSLGTISVVFYEEEQISQVGAAILRAGLSDMFGGVGCFTSRTIEQSPEFLSDCVEHRVDATYFNRGNEIRKFSIDYVLL